MIPFDEAGLYNDPHLDDYFTDPARHPYFISVDGKRAGLVLVSKRAEAHAPLDWTIAEFFIAYPYRRKGVGMFVMEELFRQYKGEWQIKYHSKNVGSEIFRHKIASEASGG